MLHMENNMVLLFLGNCQFSLHRTKALQYAFMSLICHVCCSRNIVGLKINSRSIICCLPAVQYSCTFPRHETDRLIKSLFAILALLESRPSFFLLHFQDEVSFLRHLIIIHKARQYAKKHKKVYTASKMSA